MNFDLENAAAQLIIELGQRGVHADRFTTGPDVAGINIWGEGGRFPLTSVVISCNLRFADYAWGRQYEHTVPLVTPVPEVAEAITATLPRLGRDEEQQTLHGVGKACALMMLAEQMWTPGDEAQVQDRIWRIGQDREVTITNALLAGTIDEQIYDQRAKKKRTIDAAIDAIPTDLGEKDGVVHIANLLIYGNGSLIGR